MAARSMLAIVCPEKQRFLEDFASTMSEYHRMQSAQVAAVLNGEDSPFENWINNAAARKDQAKYAVLGHREQHG
jgi:hypothetical protein